MKRDHTKTIAKAHAYKQKMCDVLGGKCQVCGYDRCLGALEFHHKDPKTREFAPTDKIYAHPGYWPKVLKELEKCALLCANCHREVHAGLIPAYPGVYPRQD